MKIELSESLQLSEATSTGPTGGAKKFRIRLIESDKWGSSGYYSRELLESAVKNKIFGRGLHMYVNHPSVSEQMDRPERSIKDLAGILDSDAVLEKDGLWGESLVFPHYAEVIESMKDHIGVSIRAWANVEQGEAQGRRGPIVKEFTEAGSVDYVTKAGAGGKITQLLEAARGGLITEVATDDRRDQIQRALPGRTWLRDYDPEAGEVYYTTYDASEKSITYAQKYSVAEDDQSITLDAQPWEVRVVTTYVPVKSAGQTTSESSNKELIKMPEIPADKLAELEEKAAKLAEAERVAAAEKARADAAEAKIAEAALVKDAEKAIKVKIATVENLHPAIAGRVTEALTADPKLIPIKEGKLDEPALGLLVESKITAEQDFLKAFAPQGVKGFGDSASTAETITESKGTRTNAWGREQKGA